MGPLVSYGFPPTRRRARPRRAGGEQRAAGERGGGGRDGERRREADGRRAEAEQRDHGGEGEARHQALKRQHGRAQPRIDQTVHVDVEQRLPEAVEHAARQDEGGALRPSDEAPSAVATATIPVATYGRRMSRAARRPPAIAVAPEESDTSACPRLSARG